MSLTIRQFAVYYRNAKDFEDQDQIRAFEVSIFPYQKEDQRKQLINHYSHRLNKSFNIISNPKEVEDSWAKLKSGDIYGS